MLVHLFFMSSILFIPFYYPHIIPKLSSHPSTSHGNQFSDINPLVAEPVEATAFVSLFCGRFDASTGSATTGSTTTSTSTNNDFI